MFLPSLRSVESKIKFWNVARAKMTLDLPDALAPNISADFKSLILSALASKTWFGCSFPGAAHMLKVCRSLMDRKFSTEKSIITLCSCKVGKFVRILTVCRLIPDMWNPIKLWRDGQDNSRFCTFRWIRICLNLKLWVFFILNPLWSQCFVPCSSNWQFGSVLQFQLVFAARECSPVFYLT